MTIHPVDIAPQPATAPSPLAGEGWGGECRDVAEVARLPVRQRSQPEVWRLPLRPEAVLFLARRCAKFLLAIAILSAAATFAQAQRKLIDPPIAGRPVDFSNVVGNYAIEASAAPLELTVEEPITLTVRISARGTVDARYEPRRKNLHILPDWTSEFYVEPAPDEDRVENGKTWLFVYRLRPKHTEVKSIDEVKLVYYDPTTGKYARRFADPIKNLVVKPKPDVTGDIQSRIEAPESFWQIDDSNAALNAAGQDFRPSPTMMAIALLVPPLVCAFGVVLWRRLRPDDARERANSARAAAACIVEFRANAHSPLSCASICKIVSTLHRRSDTGRHRRLSNAAVCEGTLCTRSALFEHWDAIRFANGAIARAADRLAAA